ncbi:MAG: hydrogenase nickel incorporation protein HypB [Burkholderiaceae bacterium]
MHADGSVHVHSHEHHGDHAHGHDAPLHQHADGSWHSHSHSHTHAPEPDHVHDEAGTLHYGLGAAHSHAPGMSQARMVKIEQDILGKNDALAAANRQRLADLGVFAVNLVSSPGSGKTTLLAASIGRLLPQQNLAVIEGDQQTANDADRIRAAGAPAIQVNTGKGCHLDAAMVGRALDKLALDSGSVLFIENVGNLVCPAAFDLGEAHKVAVLSVTEGEDKPLKYPDMFRAASLMLLNKVDLLPYLNFDVEQCIAYARQVNPGIQVIQVSATQGAGMDEWLAWVREGATAAREAQLGTVEGLRARVAELEGKLEEKIATRH